MAKTDSRVKQGKISDFTPDPHNANKGTERGRRALDDSLRTHGAGRSILVDQNGIIIAGNKTAETAVDIGLEDAIVVPTDGTQVVVVQRTDIDINTPEGRALAWRDNRVAQVDLDWSLEALVQDIQSGALPDGLFYDWEIEKMILNLDQQIDPNEEWRGMPEFEQEDLLPAYSIRVNFKSLEDLRAFAALIEQRLTDKTRSVWYPPQSRTVKNEVWSSEP